MTQLAIDSSNDSLLVQDGISGSAWGVSWGTSWGTSWGGTIVSSPDVLLVDDISVVTGPTTSDGGGHYPGIDVLQLWLNQYFPPAYLKTPEEKREESTVDAFNVVELTPELVGELARLDGIQALFEKALELDRRESTARAARKKRQIARERDELRQQLTVYVKKLRRKRQDNEAIEKILEYV